MEVLRAMASQCPGSQPPAVSHLTPALGSQPSAQGRKEEINGLPLEQVL